MKEINLTIPDKLLEKKLNKLQLGLNNLIFYTKEEIKEKQIGYHYNSDYQKIEDWIGNNYLIIGYETLLGDLFLIDINDKQLPVYSMYYDDWNTILKITKSIDDFRKILNIISNKDLSNKEIINNLINEIKNINQGLELNYWQDLLWNAYEDLKLN